MKYLRRSVSFYFALLQLKLDFASMCVDDYVDIFDRMSAQDPGLRVLQTKVVKAKSLLLPFIHYKDSVLRSVSDVDNVLIKHPLYGLSLTQSFLVSINDILSITDKYVRDTWDYENREDEVHFMFALLSLIRFHKESLCNRKAFPNFDLNFIETEAFLVLKEYAEDYGRNHIFHFYTLAFSALSTNKPARKE